MAYSANIIINIRVLRNVFIIIIIIIIVVVIIYGGGGGGDVHLPFLPFLYQSLLSTLLHLSLLPPCTFLPHAPLPLYLLRSDCFQCKILYLIVFPVFLCRAVTSNRKYYISSSIQSTGRRTGREGIPIFSSRRPLSSIQSIKRGGV